MTKIVQVVATVEETLLPVSVTGAPAGAGVAVAYTTQSTSLSLTNTSLGCDVQYKVASGAWLDLERGCGIDIAIDFSTTALYLRRSTIDGGPATCSLSIDGVPVVRVSNQLLALGSAGASTYAALTDKATVDLPATNTPLAAALAGKQAIVTPTPLAVDKTLAVADDGKIYSVSTAITVTVPIGLVPKPQVIFNCPATGSITFICTSAVNGNTTTKTRERAYNFSGVVLTPNAESDSYGLSGV